MSIDRILAITTCNLQGWKQHGHRMALSWAERWPLPLTIYAEGFSPGAIDGIKVRDIYEAEWLARFKRVQKHRSDGKDFRFDAVKFSHKVAAVTEAAKQVQDYDWLIWCDADTFTHADVPEDFIKTLLPTGDEYIAWLDRVGPHNRPPLYPECGFFVLNMRHPQHMSLMLEWVYLYTSGGIFKLPEWHDSYTLQYVVERRNLQVKSLSLEGRRTTHPFINGPLGAYMDHAKGPTRKLAGHSWALDLKVKRNEAYWKAKK